MSAVVLSEGLIHYEAFGRGRPVIFLHSWLGSWRYWVPTMEELSVRQRAYAIDLFGFGDSDKPGRNYHVDAYVKLLRDFLDKLGVAHPTLVGHGLGGVVALRFVAENPGWADQVMAVNAPLLGDAVNRPLASFSGDKEALLKPVKRFKFSEVEMEVPKTDASAISASVNSVLEADLRPLLPPLTIPTLLVYGGADPFVRSAEPEWLRFCDDNVRAISIDSAQHFPMLEEQNKFNRLLKEFLDAGNNLKSLELKEEWQRRLR